MSLFGSQKTKAMLTAMVMEGALKKEALSDYVNDARKRYHNLARWITKNGRCSLAGLGLLRLPSAEEVVNDSIQLCKEYLLQRLSQEALLSPRMDYLSNSIGLSQRSKTFVNISSEVQNAASELEDMHPDLYNSVAKQLSLTITSEAQVRRTLLSLAAYLYKGNITWGKIIAGFSLAGAMACDCVRQERPEYVRQVLDTFTKITREYTAEWIIKQGGWVDLTIACKTSSDMPLLWTFSIIGATIGFCLTLVSTVAI